MDIHARASGHPAPYVDHALQPAPEFDTAILWLRRDLRLDDNPALVAASRQARRVVPLFIYAPDEEGEFKPGKCSRWWLKDSLAALDDDLHAVGSRLIKRSGLETLPVLLQVLQETKASAVFFNNLYDPISLVRDQEVKEEMAARGVVCQTYNSELLYEPWEVLDGKGAPFSTFEGFWNRVTVMPYPPQPSLVPPEVIPPVPEAVISATDRELAVMSEDEEMLSSHFSRWWTPGSAAGMERAVKFMHEGLRDFDKDRSKTDRESTSKLSPHIHFGEISTRRIYWAVKQFEWKWAFEGDRCTSCADFLRQLGYREYGRYLSYHFPLTHEKPLLVHLRACPWNLDQSLFKAWRQGATGYPLVDAGMLELWSNGWIHNRLRVVCSSFLVKNMLLPWQWGLKHFWDCLLDADLECDALGFQYVAGCLLDAHPFGFMHDIAEESRRFDPDGTYVRKWLPSLARMPTKYIHNPSAAPASVLAEAGVDLGTNYPFPIVSPEESQQRLSYACDVIARCCPDSPKHGVEPYYPPSDPALDPDAARNSQPYRNPSQGDNIPTQTHCSELRAAESDMASNDISGCAVRQSMAQGGNALHKDIVEQGAEDDEGETTSQRNETATSSREKQKRRLNLEAGGSSKAGKRGMAGSTGEGTGTTDGGTASGVDLVETGSPDGVADTKQARLSFEARRARRQSY